MTATATHAFPTPADMVTGRSADERGNRFASVYCCQLLNMLPDLQGALGPSPWHLDGITAWYEHQGRDGRQLRSLEAALAGAVLIDLGIALDDGFRSNLATALTGWQLGLTMTGKPRRGFELSTADRIHACQHAVRILGESLQFQEEDVFNDLSAHLHWIRNRRVKTPALRAEKWSCIAEGAWLLRDQDMLDDARERMSAIVCCDDDWRTQPLADRSRILDAIAMASVRCGWTHFDDALAEHIADMHAYVHPGGCVPSRMGERLPVSPVAPEVLAGKMHSARSLACKLRAYITRAGYKTRWSTREAANFALAAAYATPDNAGCMDATEPLSPMRQDPTPVDAPVTRNGNAASPDVQPASDDKTWPRILATHDAYVELDIEDHVTLHVTFPRTGETITCWRPAVYRNEGLLVPMAGSVRIRCVPARASSANAENADENRFELVGRLKRAGSNNDPTALKPKRRWTTLARAIRRVTGAHLLRRLPGIGWVRSLCRSHAGPRFRRIIQCRQEHVTVRDVVALHDTGDVVYLAERTLTRQGTVEPHTHQFSGIRLLDVVRSYCPDEGAVSDGAALIDKTSWQSGPATVGGKPNPPTQ